MRFDGNDIEEEQLSESIVIVKSIKKVKSRQDSGKTVNKVRSTSTIEISRLYL